MPKYSLKDITTPGFQLPADYNELVSVYRTLAKTADQRLVRLEKYANDPYMGNALTWAYAKAEQDIKHWSGEQANRFNTAPPKTYHELRAKVMDIKTFIESPSSTKKGIKSIYQQRADTINDKYGTNFTWQEIGDFFESEFFQKLSDTYGSQTVVEAVGKIQKDKNKIKAALEKMEEEKKKTLTDKQIIRVPNNDVLQDVVNSIVEQYPDEVKELLKL